MLGTAQGSTAVWQSCVMAKRPSQPVDVNVNLGQFDSLSDALSLIAVNRPFDDLATKVMTDYIGHGGEWTLTYAFFSSAVTRGRALHEATVREISAGNPPAAITLLRQLAETVAMTFYVADHPHYVEVLATPPLEEAARA